jgi:hypothetical protein
MTWTKLSDTFTDDPVLLRLPRSVRLVHVEALVWCNRQGTDGAIPRHALRRLTDEPDDQAAAAALVEAGVWAVADDGWQIVDFTGTQITAARVREIRDATATRTRMYRDHQQGRRHEEGCGYCKRRGDASRDAVSDGVSDAAPTRSDPTRSVKRGKGGSGNGSTQRRSASERRSAAPNRLVRPDGAGVTVDEWRSIIGAGGKLRDGWKPTRMNPETRRLARLVLHQEATRQLKLTDEQRELLLLVRGEDVADRYLQAVEGGR